MNPCPEYQQELAATAALDREPAHELALHLQSCSACSRAFTELRATAARHVQTASQLPEPRSNARVDAWFLGKVRNQGGGADDVFAFPAFRRLLVPIIASVLLAAGLFFAMRDRNSIKAPTVVSAEPSVEIPAANPAPDLVPTWNSFRQQAESDDPNLGSARERGGTVMAHYRVKDGYSELGEVR